MSLIIQDTATQPAEWPPAEPLALQTSYELDPFQKHAVIGIHANDHVFVTAKTGSGKTFVGEYLIARHIAAGKRVFYTTPIKSLSNQKYSDLKRLFPDTTVGILTGDIKMCPDAQIVVMTAEILRNLLYKRGTATEGVGLTAAVTLDGVAGVVIDEAHYIQDTDRGHVWEETLILCPRDIQLVLLSATMPSAAELGQWLATLHGRNVHLLSTSYRVVPLVHGMLERSTDPSGWSVRPLLDVSGNWIGTGYTGWLQSRKEKQEAAVAYKRTVDARRAGGYSAPPPIDKVTVEKPIARLRRTITWLEATRQLPALFFTFSRKNCERLASYVEGALIDTSDAAAAAHIFDFHLSRHRTALETSPQYHQIRELLVRGIAFHHSGLQPLLKEIVEILFVRGYVKALFATETFAVGLNMPTKTVVFLELSKWADDGHRRLRPDEYIQMAGRAGRRGLDKQGLVLYEPMDEPIEAWELKAMLTGALPPLSSRMRFGYEFILRQRLANAPSIASQSFWALQQQKARDAAAADVAELKHRIDACNLAPEMVAALSERTAIERTIAETVNAKRKKAQRELEQWDMTYEDQFPRGQLAVAIERWKQHQALVAEYEQKSAALTTWTSETERTSQLREDCLKRWGFIAEDGSLTLLGQTATEVNEGHPILMPLLADAGILADVSAEEIVQLLALFITDGGKSDLSLVDTEIGTHPAAKWLVHQMETCAAADIYGEWSLNAMWPDVIARWLHGDTISQIATDYELFEGNVYRAILKMANLVEEWKAVATLRRDLAMLEKMNGLVLFREGFIIDSLYITS